MIRTLSLFSGIGGIDLGLERTGGFQVVGQCEIDPFCREVLAKHWPNVWRHDDIATLTAGLIRERCGQIDCICGGFPCQDVSAAGKGAGIVAGERSGLWWQMFRIIATVRPRWIVAENVPALRTRGADDIIAVLEGIGYACWPLVVGAWAVGAPHKRDRVWIVAHSARNGQRRQPEISRADRMRTGAASDTAGMADTENKPSRRREIHARQSDVAWRGTRWPARPGQSQYDWEHPRLLAHTTGRKAALAGYERESPAGDSGECAECAMGSAADGVSGRLVRFANRNALKAYGNAVVPQVVTAIGNAILSARAADAGQGKERE